MELSFKNQESQTRVKKNEKFLNESQREFTFLSWNIGYAGLGKEMDFFYDESLKNSPPKHTNCLIDISIKQKLVLEVK